MACLIRDVRKDLNVPKMPFVIGVLGVGGEDSGDNNKAFREAMAAPAATDEFKGNVAALYTHKFWPADVEAVDNKAADAKAPFNKRANEIKKMEGDEKKKAQDELQKEIDAAVAAALSEDEQWLLKNGKSNTGYHYLGSAKFFAQLGEAFAKALQKMGN